jgi:hypothetical protein
MPFTQIYKNKEAYSSNCNYNSIYQYAKRVISRKGAPHKAGASKGAEEIIKYFLANTCTGIYRRYS